MTGRINLHVLRRLAGLARWALAVAPLPAPLLAALLGVLVSFKPNKMPRRLLYSCEAALDIFSSLLACTMFHRLYPAAVGASPLCAVAAVAAGNGVLALACQAKTSPLPFRWQLPVVAAVGAALLAYTPAFCSSGLLQHGWATLHTLGCVLLPLLAPALIDLSPPDGLAALAARAPPASDAGAAQCTAYQASSVVLGCAALACHLYRAERRQRKAAAVGAGGRL